MAKSPKSIALIGVGRMAALHAQAIGTIPGLRIVSCASRSMERAEAFARKHNIPRPRLFHELLERPEADALWVVAPAMVMAELAVQLNATGLPLFLEKPAGLDLGESRAAAAAITAPHMVGLNRRFYEIIGKGRDLIAEAGGLRAIEVHMPEDIRSLPDKHAIRVKEQWQFANSIHLIDLFRFFAGDVASVETHNEQRDGWDRSYTAFIGFSEGAKGIFNAQWYAPGGWRITLYAEDLSITYQPIERAIVMRRGADPEILEPQGPDREIKAGLHGQAEAFLELLLKGRLPDRAADLADYVRSVELVHDLTETAGVGE